MRELVIAIAAFAIPLCAWSSVPCAESESDFGVFANRFASDKVFRLERVSFPLPVLLGDGKAQEQVRTRWSLARFKANDRPLFLSTATLKRRGLSQRVRSLGALEREVFQFRPEADDYRYVFHFRQVDGCWYLVSYADISL